MSEAIKSYRDLQGGQLGRSLARTLGFSSTQLLSLVELSLKNWCSIEFMG